MPLPCCCCLASGITWCGRGFLPAAVLVRRRQRRRQPGRRHLPRHLPKRRHLKQQRLFKLKNPRIPIRLLLHLHPLLHLLHPKGLERVRAQPPLAGRMRLRLPLAERLLMGFGRVMRPQEGLWSVGLRPRGHQAGLWPVENRVEREFIVVKGKVEAGRLDLG